MSCDLSEVCGKYTQKMCSWSLNVSGHLVGPARRLDDNIKMNLKYRYFKIYECVNFIQRKDVAKLVF